MPNRGPSGNSSGTGSRITRDGREIPADNGPRSVKIVLVGDTSVGKTCLIRNYLENVYHEDYEPTVLDVYKGVKNVKKRQLNLEIHDTSGDHSLFINRQMTYTHSDVFIVCVSVNSRDSCENVSRWATEIRQVVPRAPIIICLTKKDLLEYTDSPVTEQMIKDK